MSYLFFMVLGVLGSMSSGPLMMLLFSIVFLSLERCKHWVKPLLVLVLCGAAVIEVVSNRTLYHVIASYADPIGGTGWHRARLIDCAIETFGQWWFAGYGGGDPGWGEKLGMTWTDITNHYLVHGVKYGFLSIVAFVGILVSSLRRLIMIHNNRKDTAVKSWSWALGTVVIVLLISFNAFTAFGQTETLFYCILGFIGSSWWLAESNCQPHERSSCRTIRTRVATASRNREGIGVNPFRGLL